MSASESREPGRETLASPVAPGYAARSTGSSGPVSSAGSAIRKIGLIVILLAAGALGYWKLKGNKKEAEDTANRTAQQANRAIPVTSAAAVARTMPIYLTALGTVTAYNTVTVKSRVDGQLLSVNVREGQQVAQGQTLAMIDPRPYVAAVAQAKGQLAKDQATADYAKAEAGRYNSLYEAGVVSKDSQQVQQSTAGQTVGALDADRAAIQAAEVNVAYSKITSPISGVVGLRQVDAGNIVHAADASGLLVVTQLQPISVIFTLPEDQLPAVLKLIRGGSKLVAEAYDRSQTTKLATGQLLTLDNEIDTTTGTVKAKAVFDNKDGALFPNQFVNIRLVLENRQNALVVPGSALQSGTAGSFVYLIKPGAAPKVAADDDGSMPDAAPKSKGAGKPAADAEAPTGPPRKPYYVDVQPVVVDVTEGSQVILKSGLKPGDMVVVDGQEKLKKYSKVDPKQAVRPATAPAPEQPSPDTGSGSIDEPGRRGHHGPGADAAPAAAPTPGAAGEHHGHRPGNPQ